MVASENDKRVTSDSLNVSQECGENAVECEHQVLETIDELGPHVLYCSVLHSGQFLLQRKHFEVIQQRPLK